MSLKLTVRMKKRKRNGNELKKPQRNCITDNTFLNSCIGLPTYDRANKTTRDTNL